MRDNEVLQSCYLINYATTLGVTISPPRTPCTSMPRQLFSGRAIRYTHKETMSEGEKIRSSIDKFLWPNKLILLYVGLWPMNENMHVVLRYFTYFRVVFSIVFTATIVVPQVFEIIDKWGNLEIITEVGCLTLLLILVVFKQCYIVAQHVRFESTYRLLRDLWNVSRTREESRSLEDCAWQAMFFTALFYVVGCSTYILYVAAPIYVWKVNERRANGSDYERHLLLGSRYWFDPSPTPIFEVTYAYQAIGLYSAGNSVVGLDGSMMAIIMHVVGQFRLISVRLKDIGIALRDGDDAMRKFNAWTEIENCVKHHERMLRIADDVNSLLGPLILGQLMIAGVEICLNGYTVMSGDSHGIHLIKYCFLLASAIVQLIIYCWPGEMLIQESTGVARTVCYELPWFMLPYEQQRDLCLMIVRSQRESQITALGLQVMSLQKITEVFNAAASYMALLRSMNEKQRMSAM